MLSQNGPAATGNWPSHPSDATAATAAARCFATPTLTCALAGSFQLSYAGGERSISSGIAVWFAAGVPHGLVSAASARFATLALHDERAIGSDSPLRVFRMTPLLREVALRLGTLGPAEEAIQAAAAVSAKNLEAVLCDELVALAAARIDARLPDDPQVRALCLAFLEDPSSTLSADAWAARFGLTRKTVARRFHSELHTTFGAWQRAVRVAEARVRLAAGQSVTHVAGDLGYDSLSAFAAMFRRTTGVTPSSVAAGDSNQVRGDDRRD